MTVPSPSRIVVTSYGVNVPGMDLQDLTGPSPQFVSIPPQAAHSLLGRKGLLGKEPATLLALCAVHRAFGLCAGARRSVDELDARTAVVVSSNLGNVATVQRVVRTLHEAGLRSVSALDAPNASSNVVASSIAIWFRLAGPNLMLCSGSTSGLDAVDIGARLLRAQRCDRAVVVGVEPDDDVAAALFARRSSAGGEPLRASAACVVLERAPDHECSAPVVADVRAGSRTQRPNATLTLAPHAVACGLEPVVDLERRIGSTYGALGVLQLAVGCAWLSHHCLERASVAIVTGDNADGWRSTVVTNPKEIA